MTTRRNITFNGETLSIADWSRRIGISHTTITKRLDAGWSIDRALSPKLDRRGRKPILAKQLPALVSYLHEMQTAQQQIQHSMHAFKRSMAQQMAQLQQHLDASLAAQREQACKAVMATHSPGLPSTESERSGDRGTSVAEEGRFLEIFSELKPGRILKSESDRVRLLPEPKEN